MIHPPVMRRMIVFAVVTIAALLAAAALRARDKPYIDYERGHVAEALEGLAEKANDGDGFFASHFISG